MDPAIDYDRDLLKVAKTVRKFVETYNRFFSLPGSVRPPDTCQFPESHMITQCRAPTGKPIDYYTIMKDDKFHSKMQKLSRVPASSFQHEKTHAVINQNITYLGFDDFYPHNFYGDGSAGGGKTSFRFDGRTMTVQYVYSWGLTVIVQFMEEYGTSDDGSEDDLIDDERRSPARPRYFRFGWEVLSILAYDEGTDGAGKWSPYGCLEHAREAYFEAEPERERHPEVALARELRKRLTNLISSRPSG